MAVLQWAGEREDRYIIEDDYDSEFRYASRPIPAMKEMDHEDRVIYLNTFAKSLAPSLRIGYMVLPNRLGSIRLRCPALSSIRLQNFYRPEVLSAMSAVSEIYIKYEGMRCLLRCGRAAWRLSCISQEQKRDCIFCSRLEVG